MDYSVGWYGLARNVLSVALVGGYLRPVRSSCGTERGMMMN